MVTPVSSSGVGPRPGWVVEVEAAGAIEGFFGGADGVSAGQDGVFVAVAAGEMDREAPAVGPHTGSSDKSLPEPAPKPYNPAKTDYLTQRGASIAHQHHRSSEYVFEAGAGPRARNVQNRAVSHTSHTATRPLGRLRAAAGLTRRHLSATMPTIT